MAADKDPNRFPSDFAWLAQGKSLGKRVQLLIDVDDTNSLTENPFVNVLELNGPDEAAMNVQVTIIPIRYIPIGGAGQPTIDEARALVQAQAASGTVEPLSGILQPSNSILFTPMIARLDWGIGGIANKDVDVDIGSGLNINLTCSFLRINVAADPFLSLLGIDAGSSAIYELGAFVGPGYPKRNNAQRTVETNSLFVAGPGFPDYSEIVPIPKYATRVSLQMGTSPFQTPDVTAGWTASLIFFRGPMWGFSPFPGFIADHTEATIQVTDGSCCQFMIPNNAKYVGVFSNFTPTSFPPFSAGLLPKLIFDLGI